MYPGPYGDVNDLIRRLASRISALFGADLVGLYLTGSLVTGDFDHAVSDIDLLAVSARALDQPLVDRLGAMHREIARAVPAWDDRIEVVYLPLSALKTFRTEISTMAVTSPGEPFHTKNAGREWLINWYVVRTYGQALYGPPPETIVDPISDAELIQAVRDAARDWRARIEGPMKRNFQIYAILTLCRALYTIRVGGYPTKRQAALWAAAELPEWAPVVLAALDTWQHDWYNSQVDHDATRPAAVRFIDHVIDAIDR